MPFGGLLIGGLISAGTAYAGSEAKRKASEKGENAANAYKNMLADIQLPEIEKQKLLLELPNLLAQYNPEMEQAQTLGPSAMEDIQVTPAFEEAQLGALQALQERGEQGMTASERAVLNGIRRSSGQEEHARQGQIMQNMAERGIGGSGLELASRLSSSQAAADRASQEADREAAMIQERQLAAVRDAGAMAGQVRSQEFGEKSDVSKAKDFINQFNLQNTQNVQQRNIASQNVGQMHNQTEAQRIAEKQAGLKNQEQMYNKGLDQKRFDNELARATGQAPSQQELKGYQDSAESEGKMWGDIGSKGTELVSGLFSAQASAPQASNSQVTKFESPEANDMIAALRRGTGMK